ncbi:MAG: SDR family oxidoreductase [Spirochaetia bacterium]|jgi:NAD(P)-dependent dehydrogenase (short-subunit alcohol dehydrogenase family)
MAKAHVVAISGAAGGLGPTVARAFFETGASLALAGRSEEKLVRLLDLLGVPTDRRLASGVDLANAEAARSWAESVKARFGRVDVVLHLVGGYKGGASLSELSLSDWDELHGMLIGTTLSVVRAFAGMLKAGGARFISVTSPKAQAPTAKSALYSMAKAASDALVLALADELRGTGSTANLVVVDSIDFPETRGSEPRKPYGRSTPAEEIAAAMLFLCSDKAATINGARVPLTGRSA